MNPDFKKALEEGHIEPAVLPDKTPFVRDGVTYYQASQGMVNLYLGRFMAATDVLERHDRLKLDEPLLRALLKTVRQNTLAVMARVGNPEEAVEYLNDTLTLIERTSQRLDLYADLHMLGVGSQISRVYEIAGIVFFSEQESPAMLDFALHQQKIRSWLKYPELYGFFLQMPLSAYAPLPALSEENMQSCMTALQEANRLDLLDYQRTLLKYKTSGISSDTITFLTLLTETLDAYDSSYEHLLRNSSISPPPGPANERPSLSSIAN